MREYFERTLQNNLTKRKNKGLLRNLTSIRQGIDFCSNDYLGFARLEELKYEQEEASLPVGATGSRLISGHYKFIENIEQKIAHFHNAESALIFNSGYNANIGLLSCIASSDDLIILDRHCHASLMDGVKMSQATCLKFRHNNLNDLEKKLHYPAKVKFVVVESVYSMHGDEVPLKDIVMLCDRYHALLLVDEAHTTGIYGQHGEGLVCQHNLQNSVYARVHTFGKALGLHGAAIVGSSILKNHLINYAHSFIYTTALPPASYWSIDRAYKLLPSAKRKYLADLITYFQKTVKNIPNNPYIKSSSPIQGVVLKNTIKALSLAHDLQQKNFFTKAILPPSIPKGEERIRICLHTFNTQLEIDSLLAEINKKII